MNEETKRIKPGAGEYVLYFFATLAILILAVPVIIFKMAAFLVNSVVMPLKSARHFIGAVIVIILIALIFLAVKIFVPYDIGINTKSVMVEENDSFAHLISDLKKEGIITDDYLFRRLGIFTGIDKKLAPGRYDFAGSFSLYDVLDKFLDRDIATDLVTIPEGLKVEQIAETLANKIGIGSIAFMDLVYDSVLIKNRFGFVGIEGYLFPETYRLWYGIRPDQVLDIMISEFNRRTKPVFDEYKGSLCRKDIVILASIIEAEATITDEMPVISSVYHNRLRNGMLLQADPTVLYAIGDLERPLWYRDLKIDSPYNTYKYKGLPPGPINSPGLAAIQAACFPDNSDYLYFVADGMGRHIFTKTLREHNNAKNKIKKQKSK